MQFKGVPSCCFSNQRQPRPCEPQTPDGLKVAKKGLLKGGEGGSQPKTFRGKVRKEKKCYCRCLLPACFSGSRAVYLTLCGNDERLDSACPSDGVQE
eukprot:6482306-Amphidinium_carterae.1